jgi:hypothetical protein
MALVLERHPATVGHCAQRREHVREFRSNLVVESGEPLPVQAAQEFIKCIDEDGERQVVFELGRRPAKDEVSVGHGASGELLKKTRLADPRFSNHLDRAAASSIELVQDPIEGIELVGTPNEVVAW